MRAHWTALVAQEKPHSLTRVLAWSLLACADPCVPDHLPTTPQHIASACAEQSDAAPSRLDGGSNAHQVWLILGLGDLWGEATRRLWPRKRCVQPSPYHQLPPSVSCASISDGWHNEMHVMLRHLHRPTHSSSFLLAMRPHRRAATHTLTRDGCSWTTRYVTCGPDRRRW